MITRFLVVFFFVHLNGFIPASAVEILRGTGTGYSMTVNGEGCLDMQYSFNLNGLRESGYKLEMVGFGNLESEFICDFAIDAEAKDYPELYQIIFQRYSDCMEINVDRENKIFRVTKKPEGYFTVTSRHRSQAEYEVNGKAVYSFNLPEETKVRSYCLYKREVIPNWLKEVLARS